MRRYKRLTRMIVWLLVITIGAACGGSDDQNNNKASVSSIEGILTVERARVEYRAAGSEDWAAVADVQMVRGQDTIRTDASGRALLNFYTGTELEIRPGSEIVVTQLDETDSGGYIVSLNQLSGDTWHRVELIADSASRYEVNTPSANLVVRGTVFGVAVQPDGATTVQVQEGIVQAKVGQQTIDVNAGEALDILADQSVPGTPYPIPVIRPPAATPTPTPGTP